MVLSAVAARKAKAKAEAAASGAAVSADAVAETSAGDPSPARKKARIATDAEQEPEIPREDSGAESADDALDEEEEDDVDKAAKIAQAELLSLGQTGGKVRYFVAPPTGMDEHDHSDESSASDPVDAENSAMATAEASADENEGSDDPDDEESPVMRIPAQVEASHPAQRWKGKARAIDPPEVLRQLTSWRPRFGGSEKNCIVNSDGERELLIGLQAAETISFVGVARIRVLRGAVSINGAGVRASSKGPSREVLLLAPRSNAVPVLQASSSANTGCEGDANSLPALGSACSTIVSVTPVSTCGIHDIGLACPLPSENPFEAESSHHFAQVSQPLLSVVEKETRHLRGQQMPAPWSAALDALVPRAESDSMMVLVRGPKRAGKSTLARMALERLISSGNFTQVAFLDLDLGQTEYGPPGIVSLHLFDASPDAPLTIGPSWCTARQPLRAHFVGDVTPSDAPQDYERAVSHLLDHFAAFVQHVDRPARRGRRAKTSGAPATLPFVPLVVNTMGWVKGLGADLLARLESKLEATHVFDLAITPEGGPSLAAPPYRASQHAQVIPLPAFDSAGARQLSAADTRTLSIMSYLHMTSVPSATSAWPTWDFTKPLVAVPPYEIDLKVGFPAGIHVLPFGAAVAKDLQLAALDCSIAALVAVDQSAAPVLDDEPPQYEQSTCLGLALVRSVSPAEGTLQLITPVSPDLLSAPDLGTGESSTSLALVKGAITVPVWAFLDHAHVQAAKDGILGDKSNPLHPQHLAGVPLDQLPYLTFPQATAAPAGVQAPQIIGAKVRKVRKNVMRKGQRAAMQAAGTM